MAPNDYKWGKIAVQVTQIDGDVRRGVNGRMMLCIGHGLSQIYSYHYKILICNGIMTTPYTSALTTIHVTQAVEHDPGCLSSSV